MKKTLTDWANVAEIIGAFAIVLSLIFVGVQIRENTRAAQNATFQQSVSQELGIFQALSALDREALLRWNEYRLGPGLDANQVQADPANMLFLAGVRLWENMYLQYQSGALAEWAWASREPTIRAWLLGPRIEVMLDSGVLTAEFAAYVREVRSEAGLGTP